MTHPELATLGDLIREVSLLGRLVELHRSIEEAARKVRIPARQKQRKVRLLRVDLEATTRALGLSVTRRASEDQTVQGFALGGSHIGLTRSAAYTDRYLIAHELGHILLHRSDIDAPSSLHEWIADWFARELLVPRTLLGALFPACGIRSLRGIFRARAQDVRLQLGLIGKLAPCFLLKGQLMCAACGERFRFADCECDQFDSDMGSPLDPELGHHVLEPCKQLTFFEDSTGASGRGYEASAPL